MTMRHGRYLISAQRQLRRTNVPIPLDQTLQDARVLWTIAALAAVVAIALYLIIRRGRPFAPGDVFRASRLSSGNHLFPTQVLVSPTSVIHYTPQWFGCLELSVHM